MVEDEDEEEKKQKKLENELFEPEETEPDYEDDLPWQLNMVYATEKIIFFQRPT